MVKAIKHKENPRNYHSQELLKETWWLNKCGILNRVLEQEKTYRTLKCCHISAVAIIIWRAAQGKRNHNSIWTFVIMFKTLTTLPVPECSQCARPSVTGTVSLSSHSEQVRGEVSIHDFPYCIPVTVLQTVLCLYLQHQSGLKMENMMSPLCGT